MSPKQEHLSQEEYLKIIDAESRVLFKTLLLQKRPIMHICWDLERIAREKYDKDKGISPDRLREWAGELSGKTLKKLPKWIFALAIDLLLEYKIDPLKLIPPEKVAEFWALQQVNRYSLVEAIPSFMEIFQVPNRQRDVVNLIIATIVRIYANNSTFEEKKINQ